MLTDIAFPESGSAPMIVELPAGTLHAPLDILFGYANSDLPVNEWTLPISTNNTTSRETVSIFVV